MAALLLGILEEGPVTLALEDYAGPEKVEPLGQSLSTGDSQTTTRAGNIVLNQPILQYSSEIHSAVLVIHGEKAHSCYMGREAYEGDDGGKPQPGKQGTDDYPRCSPYRPVRQSGDNPAG